MPHAPISERAPPRRGRGRGLAMAAWAVAPFAVAAAAKIGTAGAPPPPVVVVPPAPVSPAPTSPPAPAPAPGPPAKIVTDMKPPAACLAQYPDVALPRERGDDAAARQTIVCRKGRVLSYNRVTHDPDWVMERLTPAMLAGKAVRSNAFAQDPLVGGIDATNADYLGSHFDRGHQAPAADARFDQSVMNQSFLFTNMAPQIGIGFNRGVWKYLEETVRAWVSCGGHPVLYVITGPIYDTRPNAPVVGADRIAQPIAFYKIVYDPAADRAVGFRLPNAKIGAVIPDLQHYVVAVTDLEAATGLDFFGGFDRRHQTLLEAQPATAWNHVSGCADPGGP